MTWRERALLAKGLALPTLYLWLADALAIEMGIWSINPDFLLGIYCAKLPLEEMTFFVITNLMVLQVGDCLSARCVHAHHVACQLVIPLCQRSGSGPIHTWSRRPRDCGRRARSCSSGWPSQKYNLI